MALEEKEKIENDELNKSADNTEKKENNANNNENNTVEQKSDDQAVNDSDENKNEVAENKANNKETVETINEETNSEVASENSEKASVDNIDNSKNTANLVPDNTEKKLENISSNINIKHFIFKVFENVIFILIAILAIAFTIFTIVNTDNSKISSGISILGVDVSGLEKDSATDKVSAYVQDVLDNNTIHLKHNEFETDISTKQIETNINVLSAIDAAFDVGSGNNIFTNSFKKLYLLINPVDIKPTLSINKEQLDTTLTNISTQLPDSVKQSNYYIEGNELILTKGKSGVVIDNSNMTNEIIAKLSDLSYKDNPIEIMTINKDPDELDIEKVYNEVHKEAVDARFDSTTHIVYPEENGLDFKISLDEAKQLLVAEQKEEYTIPLKTLKPNVTTNMIGMEAFPDLLSTFSTRYPASNRDRTTNLKLAASKINGTVVLPGQTFSYNSVVGQRSIAAGYREAAIYQDGQVVQGLGGGICQISTTLYNAALYANLEIVERRNHQFVPSYIGAGRDATVVYGSQDFKFTNNRTYAIKITCSVDKGIATFNIHGLKEPSDCDVTITSGITSRGANSFTSTTYKTLRRNGEVISSTVVSRDTYKAH